VKISAGQESEEAGQLAGKQCAHAKKRSVMKSTVDKWIACRERQRLKYFRVAEVRYRPRRPSVTCVVTVKCAICARFEDRLVDRRNYSAAFVEDSVNLRTSSSKDHAASDMHSCAMLLLKKQVVPASSYCMLAVALELKQ